MIRKATIDDLDAIVDLGVEFGVKSKHIHTFSVDPEKIRAVAHDAILGTGAVMLVATINDKVTGVIFGLIQPAYFSQDIVLQELALYSRTVLAIPHLIKAFEEEARVKGICKVAVGLKPAFFNMREIYGHLGYQPMEEIFIKEI